MSTHETYLQRCLDLAYKALGNVSPNPLVGCVIVHNDKIIGEGYHKMFGGSHAEVNAINAVIDKELLRSSILYVNLEPCSHHGKTPPCCDLIIAMGIPEVVIGQKDPNPLVGGEGIKKLRDSGCNVKTGILERESIYLNRRFNIFHEKKRPFLILKWAQTLDGFIDIDRNSKTKPGNNWISNYQLKRLVHKWRTEEDGILIGTTTALNDNAKLTAREWPGKNPLRIVIDEELIIPDDFNVLDDSTPTIIFTSKQKRASKNTEFINIDFQKEIFSQMMDILYKNGTQSIIVEGGKMLLESLLKIDLWDEARVIIGNRVFNKGLKGPGLPHTPYSSEHIYNDKLLIFKNLVE